MGIYEKMPEPFLEALDAEFSFAAPRKHGYDTVEAIRAMRDGKARFFMGMGGNFVSATPDTAVTEAAMRNLRLTVEVSTKLNRSPGDRHARRHPPDARPHRSRPPRRDRPARHRRGLHGRCPRIARASEAPADDMLSEVAIVARIAERLFAGPNALPNAPQADWKAIEADYARACAGTSSGHPGFLEDYEARIAKGRTFFLPNG